MKKLFLTIATAILFVLILPTVSHATSWQTYKYNLQNNPLVFDATKYASSSNYSVTASDVPTPYGYPVAADGVLYYSKNFGNPQVAELYAINIQNGQLIWKNNYSRPIYNLSIYDNKLYFGADNIYCLNLSDGSEVWVARSGLVQNPIYNPFVYIVYQDVVLAQESYANFIDKSFLALNAQTGQIITNMNRYSMTQTSGILANGQNFYITSRNSFGGGVIAFDINSFNKVWHGDSCRDASQAAIDPEFNRIYLMGTTKVCVIDSTNGKKLYDQSYKIDFGLAKYGNRWRGFYGNASASFAVGDDHVEMNYGSVFTSPEKFVSPPLIVNDTIYGGSNKGRIWSKNLETGEERFSTIGDSDDYVYHMIYASGKIVAITRNDRVGANLRILDKTNLSVSPTDYVVTLDSPYNTEGHQALLGQLHAHYMPEAPEKWALAYGDYLYSPYDVEKRYKDAGYDFIALTEHNQITPDPGVEGMLHIVNSEEDTQGYFGNHILALGINTPVDETQSDQNRIDQVINQGGIPVLAHPEEQVYPWRDYAIAKLANSPIAFEGLNSATYLANKFSSCFETLDTFPYKLFATAGDDYTPDLPGFDGGAVVVFSETNSQTDILRNLKAGNFYALQGSQAPRISITAAGNSITVNSDRQSTIKFIGKGGETLQKFEDMDSASYVASGDEIYVRAEVEADGKTAWTQPIKVNKTKATQTINSGTHYTNLNQAGLTSNTTDSVNSSILPNSEYPLSTPPLGYLSPVYSFSTPGQVLDGTNLSVSYAGREVYTNPNNLSIYTYNQESESWEKVESQVDTLNQTVSANLSHFSLYALSADQSEDTESPSVSLASPADLNNLSGNVVFSANANDNNAITSVRFVIDDKEAHKDTDKDDNGWSMDVNTNDYSNGNHKLEIEAEDFSGNLGTFETSFSITSSSFVAPSISIAAPAENQYLNNPFTIAGAYSGQNDVDSISVYLDDVYITDADFASGIFQKEIDFGQFEEGQHRLKVVLRDKKDNTAEVAETINIGEELKATIISPQEKTYMHSGAIKFQFQTTPADAAGVVSKLDGKEITNNSIVNAFDLALGKHKFTVEKNGKIYAERNFEISTNLLDQIVLVNKLYKLGHIKNAGIATSIQVHLLTAKVFELLHMTKLRNQFIQKAIDFINQQNKQKKPLVDSYAKNILVDDLNCLLKSQVAQK